MIFSVSECEATQLESRSADGWSRLAGIVLSSRGRRSAHEAPMTMGTLSGALSWQEDSHGRSPEVGRPDRTPSSAAGGLGLDRSGP